MVLLFHLLNFLCIKMWLNGLKKYAALKKNFALQSTLENNLFVISTSAENALSIRGVNPANKWNADNDNAPPTVKSHSNLHLARAAADPTQPASQSVGRFPHPKHHRSHASRPRQTCAARRLINAQFNQIRPSCHWESERLKSICSQDFTPSINGTALLLVQIHSFARRAVLISSWERWDYRETSKPSVHSKCHWRWVDLICPRDNKWENFLLARDVKWEKPSDKSSCNTESCKSWPYFLLHFF